MSQRKARRRRVKPPPCPTLGTVSFETQGKALRSLRVIIRADRQAAAPVNAGLHAVFHCPWCHSWHLTTVDQAKYRLQGRYTEILLDGVLVQVFDAG